MADGTTRTQLAENMRFYGDMRFKQLTLLMAVMTLVVAGVAESPDKVLADRITTKTAAACLALAFCAVAWVMEVRSVLHWRAHWAVAQDLWPRADSTWKYLTSTNAVLCLYVGLYGFWLYCAWFWRLEKAIWVVFALLGCVLLVFSFVSYRQLSASPSEHAPEPPPSE